MIKEAGQPNTVTVATSMAGRGTDIRLGEGVKELGGLAVIGIGRMSNVRQERQARGRAGRQGDPGFSQFFVSLQDEIVKDNGSIDTEAYADGEKKISQRRLKKIINNAQRTGEEFAVISRKQSMNYDEVLQRQRKVMYEIRNGLLDGEEIDGSRIMKVAKENISDFVDECFNNNTMIDMSVINRYILDNISYKLSKEDMPASFDNAARIKRYLARLVSKRLVEKKQKLGKEQMNDFMRIATLQAIDDAWVEQVDYLQQLQAAVSGRTLAQRNPLFEYQHDALESFMKMEKTILKNMVRNILLGSVYYDSKGEMRIMLP